MARRSVDEVVAIMDSIPSHALAYEWCLVDGNRHLMHASAKRWAFPLDHDETEYNKAIDASLKKYPQALEACPERKRPPTRTHVR